MRVLHVVPGLSPQFGGPSKAVMQICKALNSKGVKADIVTTNADVRGVLRVKLNTPVVIDEVTVYFFNSPFLRKYGFSLTLVKWLKKNIDNYDLIHFHSFFSCLLLPILSLATKNKKPLILRPCGMLAPEVLKRNYDGIISSYISYIAKSIFLKIVKPYIKKISAIHYTAEDERISSKPLNLNKREIVLPLGLNFEEYRNYIDSQKLQSGLPRNDGKKIILFMSRIDPKKGLDIFVNSVIKLKKNRDDFVVIIAGSGDKHYERKIKERVRSANLDEIISFPGFIEGKEKYQMLYKADLFVLPSYNENFGISVIEAMLCGVTVVISNKVAIYREIRERNAAYIVETDENSLYDGLNDLLDDENLRNELAENGKKIVDDYYDIGKVVDKMINVYGEVIASTQ